METSLKTENKHRHTRAGMRLKIKQNEKKINNYNKELQVLKILHFANRYWSHVFLKGTVREILKHSYDIINEEVRAMMR